MSVNAADTMFREVSKVASPIYMVGGSVRDLILNKVPKDYDFTTPLTPDEIEARVHAAGRHAYLVGKRFGTIGFKLEGELVELTTFRQENYEANNRKPQVEFVTDLEADLSRRDFTINAIAYDGKKYIDPFGGRLDIMERLIKSVGNARDRFKEDPLRMLRAARFAAQLNFDVDPNMVGKIRAMADKVATVSRERWTQELDKLLVQDNYKAGLDVLNDTYLLKYMLPELWLQFNKDEFAYSYLRTIAQIGLAPKDANSRWTALLMSIGMPFARQEDKRKTKHTSHEVIGVEIARGICSRLKFSNLRTELILESIAKQRLQSA